MNNKDINKENKKLNVKKKSAVPIISVGVTWVLLCFILRIANLRMALVVYSIISVIVYFIMKQIFPSVNVEIEIDGSAGDTENSEAKKAESKKEDKKESGLTAPEGVNAEFIAKIDVYIVEIDLLHDSIEDKQISDELDLIKSNLKKMIERLRSDKDPENREMQLEQFLDYYLPTTVKILDSYRRIEKQELKGENALETKKRISETLPIIRKAFEKELDNMYKNEMLDITTDIDVLESLLAQEGLLDRDKMDMKAADDNPDNNENDILTNKNICKTY